MTTGKTRHPKTPAVAYDVEEWMWCLGGDSDGEQNEMIKTTELNKGATTCSGGAEVEEGIGGREPHSFPGNLWEAHLLQEERVQMDRVNAVHGIQTR